MEHCPLGNPFSTKNKQLWKNLFKILKKDGKIENSSILNLYSLTVKHMWYRELSSKEKSEVKNEVKKHIKKLKFKKKNGKKCLTVELEWLSLLIKKVIIIL